MTLAGDHKSVGNLLGTQEAGVGRAADSRVSRPPYRFLSSTGGPARARVIMCSAEPFPRSYPDSHAAACWCNYRRPGPRRHRLQLVRRRRFVHIITAPWLATGSRCIDALATHAFGTVATRQCVRVWFDDTFFCCCCCPCFATSLTAAVWHLGTWACEFFDFFL